MGRFPTTARLREVRCCDTVPNRFSVSCRATAVSICGMLRQVCCSVRERRGRIMVQSAAHFTHKSLTGIDIAIIVVYFIVIFAIGFYFARKERTSTDYFLASRSVGWFAIGASLFVSNISTEHFIGLAGSGATSGLAVRALGLPASLVLLFLGGVFCSFSFAPHTFTLPGFFEPAL